MNETLLTRNELETSGKYLEASARPLEIAKFRHLFDGASPITVLLALKAYQNPDGGFGHALEPDLRAKESSALCTTAALQTLRTLPAASDQTLLTGIITYLMQTLDKQQWHWRIIPRSAEQSPHAPWWDQSGGENGFDRFSLNPTAEILGYLYDYRDLVPKDILATLSETVVSRLAGLEKLEMHELLCCLRLLQTPSLPGEMAGRIRGILTPIIGKTVERNPKQWKAYGLRPLQVADSPTSPFLAVLGESVDENIRYELASRQPDGSWSPTWTWGKAFPDDWPIACQEWTGFLTVEKLMLLKKFNRIEG